MCWGLLCELPKVTRACPKVKVEFDLTKIIWLFIFLCFLCVCLCMCCLYVCVFVCVPLCMCVCVCYMSLCYVCICGDCHISSYKLIAFQPLKFLAVMILCCQVIVQCGHFRSPLTQPSFHPIPAVLPHSLDPRLWAPWHLSLALHLRTKGGPKAQYKEACAFSENGLLVICLMTGRGGWQTDLVQCCENELLLDLCTPVLKANSLPWQHLAGVPALQSDCVPYRVPTGLSVFRPQGSGCIGSFRHLFSTTTWNTSCRHE